VRVNSIGGDARISGEIAESGADGALRRAGPLHHGDVECQGRHDTGPHRSLARWRAPFVDEMNLDQRRDRRSRVAKHPPSMRAARCTRSEAESSCDGRRQGLRRSFATQGRTAASP
jgi:hypothetical protein